MIRGSLAKRYARALMSLGQDHGVVDRLGKELEELAELAAKDEHFRLIIKTPIISREAREKVLIEMAESLHYHELTLRFLQLINQKGRLSYLEQIAAAFRELMDEAMGRVRAEIITAAPLSADGEARLQAALSRLTGKEVIMTLSVDESLLAGVVARVGGLLLDGSVKTQLRAIQERLKTASEL